MNFQQSRNVTVFCGELGVYRNNVNNDDRVQWYRTVREYLEEKIFHGPAGITKVVLVYLKDSDEFSIPI
ncbi:MAG: hypothetical protein H6613_16565 [Ignavibacteriales bacterium]|nr:hypothetical protein [Ignavibacteriales bacterium]